MMNTAIGQRYAKALFELASEEGSLDSSRASLERLSEILAQHSELKNVWANPIFSREERRQVFSQVMKRVDAPPGLLRFVDLLVAKNRLAYLPEIIRAFRAMVDERLGRQTILVRTPHELKAEEKAHLQSRLEESLGRQVVLTIETDPALITGIVIQMGSRVIDGSVRGQLNKLRQTLYGRA
jgi:F-type H+-transporting ATPase subunit delta